MKDLSNPPSEEGPKAAEKFRDAMKQILSVPKAEIDRREAEYKKRRLAAEESKKLNGDR